MSMLKSGKNPPQGDLKAYSPVLALVVLVPCGEAAR